MAGNTVCGRGRTLCIHMLIYAKLVTLRCLGEWVPESREIEEVQPKNQRNKQAENPNLFHKLFSCWISEVTYRYVVEQQPIGARLFKQFCETRPELHKAIFFLEAVVSGFFSATK